MLALVTNFMVFYLAVILFEQAGILCAVAAFLVLALAGTIITSIIEKTIWTLLSQGLKVRGSNMSARSAVTKPLP